MRRLAVALALTGGVGCRGADPRAGSPEPARPVSAPEPGRAGEDRGAPAPGPPRPTGLPRLPATEDGARELRDLDARVEVHVRRAAAAAAPLDELVAAIGHLLDRAAVHGALADYVDAVDLSARAIAAYPARGEAWLARARALARVHRFADARAALARARGALGAASPEADALEATLAEATGDLAAARPLREAAVASWANPEHLTLLAGDLALAGDLDGALAATDRAFAALRAATAVPLAWMLFQRGRLHELRGEPASARALHREALARLPGALEPTVHLGRLLLAAGERDAARPLVAAALAAGRHPEVVALAADLADGAARAALVREAALGWERYLAALPEAFADHAARFYLAAGQAPARALELARANLRARATREARALVVEAALAAGQPAAACEAAGPLAAPPALRAERFLAWRALAACGRPEAARLGAELGITDAR